MGKKKPTPTPDTVITLTLPGEGGIQRTGTLLIQRGDLAQLRQFQYTNIADIAEAIATATAGIVDLLAAPPPNIDMTKAVDWTPNLEARRKQLVPGVEVKTADGLSGYVSVAEAQPEDGDSIAVDVEGQEVRGYYPVDQLTIVPQRVEVEQSTVDPLAVKGTVKKAERLAPDISPKGEEPAQLSMF